MGVGGDRGDVRGAGNGVVDRSAVWRSEMTREQVVKQVLGRVQMPESVVGLAQESLNRWVAMFPQKYVFGSHEVMAGCRLVRRELGLR